MARTPEGRHLTARHRRMQLQVRAAAVRDLQRLWRTVDPTDLSSTIEPFADASVVVVQQRHRQSSAVASRYVRDLRSAERVPGSLTVAAARPPSPRETQGLLRGAALSGIINARRRGMSPQSAAQNGFVRTAGSLSSVVLAGGRDLVDTAVRQDTAAVGWMRVTSAEPCEWCAMLASRGPVFKTASSAAFGFEPDQFHDHDGCVVEPVYDERAESDRSQWPAESRRLRDVWDEATDGLGGADARRAFREALGR